MCLYNKEDVLYSCLMIILGTGGAGASALVAHNVARDDDTTLIDCFELVSCVKVSS
jgi:hypothetical protein